MSLTTVTKSKLTNLANAVRSKTGSSDLMTLDEMVANIGSIQSDQLSPLLMNTLTDLVLSEGVTSIPDRFCMNKTALKSVSFPSTLSSIGTDSFMGCGLTSVSLPRTNTGIGLENRAFYACQSLTEVTFNQHILFNGEGAFFYCENLTTVNFNLEDWEDFIIGRQAFNSCVKLANLNNLANTNILSIGQTGFSTCRMLPNLDIKGIYSIGVEAFYSAATNRGYTSDNPWTVILRGQNLGSIGDGAFNTSAPLELHLEALTPPTLGSNAFKSNSLVRIVVPYSSGHTILDAYKAATNWSNFAAFMVEAQP